MKKYFILLTVVLATISSCKKDNGPQAPEPPQHQDPPTGGDDVRTVLLKDVEAQTLPAPYFHFSYDDQHYVKQIDFASGLFIYDVVYENKRVTKMINRKNQNIFLYSYDNNRVSEINEYFGSSGKRKFSYRFSYNASNQLTQVLWFAFDNTNGAVFKKQELTYQPDGNLATIEHYYSISAEPLKLVKKDLFSDYDDKTNVDDFYLLKEFVDSYFFLPQVKLQKNNPLRQQIITVENDYEISYTYEYLNTLPVNKRLIMKQTRGTGSGQTKQFINQFSYY
jgi:hypothetical protein